MSRHLQHLKSEIIKILSDTVILFVWGFCVWLTRVVVIDFLLSVGVNRMLAEFSHTIFMIGLIIKPLIRIIKDIQKAFHTEK